MAAKRICRVCGKPYDACHTLAPSAGTFRWQDVACCPEHGAEYLRLIMISRGELPNGEPENAEKAKTCKARKARKATE